MEEKKRDISRGHFDSVGNGGGEMKLFPLFQMTVSMPVEEAKRKKERNKIKIDPSEEFPRP